MKRKMTRKDRRLLRRATSKVIRMMDLHRAGNGSPDDFKKCLDIFDNFQLKRSDRDFTINEIII